LAVEKLKRVVPMQDGEREVKSGIVSQIYQVVGKALGLEYAVERLAQAIIAARGSGDLSRLLESASQNGTSQDPVEKISAGSRLDEIERREVSAALERNRWIQRKAAKDLGLTSRQMGYRVKKFALTGEIREKRSQVRKKR
jgi:Nif-specific regulatory protein